MSGFFQKAKNRIFPTGDEEVSEVTDKKEGKENDENSENDNGNDNDNDNDHDNDHDHDHGIGDGNGKRDVKEGWTSGVKTKAAVAAANAAAAAGAAGAAGAAVVKARAQRVAQHVAHNPTVNAVQQRQRKLKNAIKKRVVDGVEDRIDALLDQRGRRTVKAKLLKDGMPQVLRRGIAAGVDRLWPDIKQEIWSMLQHSYLIYVDDDDDGNDADDADAGGGCGCCMRFLRRCRAWFLYTLDPYDRTIWDQLRTFSWWLLLLVKIAPVWGIQPLMYLLIFLLMDRSDESQLQQFILDFKASMFFTLGVIGAIMKAVQYTICVNYTDPHDDRTSFTTTTTTTTGTTTVTTSSTTPTSFYHRCDSTERQQGGVDEEAVEMKFWVDVGGLLFQVCLLWLAMAMLPCSEVKGLRRLAENSPPRRYVAHDGDGDNTTEAGGGRGDRHRNCCGCTVYSLHGNWLKKLVLWDASWFVLCCIAGFILLFSPIRPYHIGADTDTRDSLAWLIRSDVDSLRIVYGLTSLPFIIFLIPVVNNILLHQRRTGYNRRGVCVPQLIPKQIRPIPGEVNDDDDDGMGKNQHDSDADDDSDDNDDDVEKGKRRRRPHDGGGEQDGWVDELLGAL